MPSIISASKRSSVPTAESQDAIDIRGPGSPVFVITFRFITALTPAPFATSVIAVDHPETNHNTRNQPPNPVFPKDFKIDIKKMLKD